MINEEWLKTLPTDKLCEMLICCNVCAYAKDGRCTDETECRDGILEWLKGEHNDK